MSMPFIHLLSLYIISICAIFAKSATCEVASMVLVPGGTFLMGGDAGLMGGNSQSHNSSYPIHEVTINSFWMDITEVTNRQFEEFVNATGYITFAERPLPKEYVARMRKMAAINLKELERAAKYAVGSELEDICASIEQIQAAVKQDGAAGAIVFTPPKHRLYNSMDETQWWRILPSANWRSPNGEGSSIIGLEDHPVVNIAHEDAEAYARWCGKRLPTEAEWERAARGNLIRKPYVWGDLVTPNNLWMANIWQGTWPYENSAEDGYLTTAPVKSFLPNAFGLYDMSGNVWELVADRYWSQTYASRQNQVVVNPIGPSHEELIALGQQTVAYVTRGGSFLCSDNWCRGYQPGSRQSLHFDSPANHTGFRCVKEIKND